MSNAKAVPPKDIFSSSEAARICRVSQKILQKWVDTGLLYGYRLPGSTTRRIPKEDLRRFMIQHGMPLRELEETPKAAVEVPCADCGGKKEHFIPGVGFKPCGPCKGTGVIFVKAEGVQA